MKNVKLYEEFIEEGIGDTIKAVGKKIVKHVAKKVGLDKLQTLSKKTKALTKKTDNIANKAAKAKQEKTPEGNLEVSLAGNQMQQAKLDFQKIKLQQAEVKIKQQIAKAKELEAQQKQMQQQAPKKEEPKKESFEIKQRVKLFEAFVNEAEAAEIFSDALDSTLMLGYKIETNAGQHGVILRIPTQEEYKQGDRMLVLMSNGLTAKLDHNKDIKSIVSKSEPTKADSDFLA